MLLIVLHNGVKKHSREKGVVCDVVSEPRIDSEIFHKVVLSILNAHAPLKKKHYRANHATFVTIEFRKAVMKRERSHLT